jgi:hypothetical protein
MGAGRAGGSRQRGLFDVSLNLSLLGPALGRARMRGRPVLAGN